MDSSFDFKLSKKKFIDFKINKRKEVFKYINLNTIKSYTNKQLSEIDNGAFDESFGGEFD